MRDDETLKQVIRRLVRAGVEVRVTPGGRYDLLIRSRGKGWGRKDEKAEAARAVLEAFLPLLRENYDAAVRLWPEVAAGPRLPEACERCLAAVYLPDEAKEHPWAFCDSLCCPYRTDEKAVDARYWSDRRAREAAERAAREDRPIPD